MVENFKKRYWLRGGILATSIFIFLTISGFFMCFETGNYFCNIYLNLTEFNLFSPDKVILEINANFLTTFLIYLVFGLIIGLIYGKFKQKTVE